MRKPILLLLALAPAAIGCGDAPAAANDAESTGETAGFEEPARGSAASDTARAAAHVVLFFGNSLTAGFGVPEETAFPARIQQKIDSAGLPFRVVAAGVSGETSAGGARRIEWLARRQPFDIFVLELGGNDALRGIDPAVMERNLRRILDEARAARPRAELVIAGMRAPPNLGPDYTRRFAQVFRDLAEEYDAALIPFLLEGVGGVPRLNLPDRIHPTPEGHAVVAANVWETLEPVLRRAAAVGREVAQLPRVQIRTAPHIARPTSNWIGSSLEPR